MYVCMHVIMHVIMHVGMHVICMSKCMSVLRTTYRQKKTNRETTDAFEAPQNSLPVYLTSIPFNPIIQNASIYLTSITHFQSNHRMTECLHPVASAMHHPDQAQLPSPSTTRRTTPNRIGTLRTRYASNPMYVLVLSSNE